MEIKYRIDTVDNNDRLHVDVRDVLSLLQGISSETKLNLDLKTMMYVESVFSSMLTTYEATDEEAILVITNLDLKKLKKRVFKNANKKLKLLKKYLNKPNMIASEALEDDEEIEATEE